MNKILIVMMMASAATMLAAEAKPIQLQAISDFPNIVCSDAPFYKDTRTRALAINAANRALRNKWARAEVAFTGEAGTYDITITTLVETDGESTYRIFVNGIEAGTFQNPEAQKDYTPLQHTWPGISIPSGATLAVEARAHTNGRIPERGGTAWSRARWRSLVLAPAE